MFISLRNHTVQVGVEAKVARMDIYGEPTPIRANSIN
jgi:hypothetical protein